MPELKVTAPSFNLSSSWRCAKNGSTSSWFICYGPTTGSYQYTFTYALPTGAVIQRARVHASWGSPISGIALNQVNGGSFGEDGFVDITNDVSQTQAGVTFAFRANGIAYADTNLHTGSLGYKDVYLLIDYILPMSRWNIELSEVAFGGTLSATIEASDSMYSHRMQVEFGNKVAIADVPAGVASCQVEIPSEWMEAIPNATSGLATITMSTLMGDDILGEEIAQVRLLCPESVLPMAGVLMIDTDNMYNGICLQHISSAIATLTGASGAYGSTIVTIAIAGNGRRSASHTLDLGVLSYAGETICTATVTDSRGRTATTSAVIEVVPYTVPEIQSIVVERCDEDNRYSPVGLGGHVQVACSCAVVPGNSVTMQVQYKAVQESSWSALQEIIPDETGFYMFAIPGTEGQLLSSRSYEVRILISDSVGAETEVLNLIGTAYVFCSWEPKTKAFGFGCYPEGKSRLQIAADWSVYIGQEVLFDYSHPIGSVLLLSEGVEPDEKSRATWQMIGTVEIGSQTVKAWMRSQ